MGEPSRANVRSGDAEHYRRWYWTPEWKQRRRDQLRRDPFCAFCLKRGVYAAARIADHITPHRGDAALFWRGPLQSLCKDCHDREKQIEEAGRPASNADADGWPTDPRAMANGGTGAVSREYEARRMPPDLRPSAVPLTILCGPPGGGKSWHVRQHAQPADVLIDLDAILASLSGLPLYHAPRSWLPLALEERNRQLRALATDSTHRAAWFIVAAPSPTDRARWASRLGGRLIVLAPPLAICTARIMADPEREGQTERMVRAAREWFRGY